MNKQVIEAAYHEAGHAVVAIKHGFTVLSVAIRRNVAENRWDGETRRPPGRYALEGTERGRFFIDISGPLREIAIACAGFLAQAKCHAIPQSPALKFSREQQWESLHTWMGDPSPESLEPFQLQFQSPAAIVPLAVQARWFGGRDRTVYFHETSVIMKTPMGKDMNELFIETIHETMDILDSEGQWANVTTLADALTARCDERSATIGKEEIAQLLEV